MNRYRTEFFAKCPNNGLRIKYQLEIVAGEKVMVEDIIAAVDALSSGFHEDIADQLHARLGHQQVLTAHHHGVDIETIRPHVAHWMNASEAG